jgi:hypothetical protein
MSATIDKLYINFLSGRLEKFRWIRPDVALCRCPFCGDGKKGTRTRFYIYINAKYGSNAYNTDCKNCGFSGSFHNFLKGWDPGLFQEYRLEKFREKFGREPRQMFQQTTTETSQVIDPRLDTVDLVGAVKLSELPEDHPCVQYVKKRQIPYKYLNYLMHTDDFRRVTASFKDAEYAKKMPEDERLIIPFYNEFGELLCYQGRSLNPNDKIRYITVKKHDAVSKVFGMDMIDRSKEVRVCEGPIDSMFINNCLASADADLTKIEGNVYIFDAQYRNKDVCRHIQKAIDSGVKVVLFPKEFVWKDINESVTDGGLTMDDIENVIKKNTYQGLKAKLVFGKLKGCNDNN